MIVVFVIFSICAIIYLCGMGNNVMENFSQRERSAEVIKTERDTIEDRLLVNKYRKSYEDTIIELEDVISVAILSEVLENAEKIAKKPNSDTIFKINQMKMFKDTLNDAMKTLDKK
jgi:hypothetical protein